MKITTPSTLKKTETINGILHKFRHKNSYSPGAWGEVFIPAEDKIIVSALRQYLRTIRAIQRKGESQ